MSKKRVIKSDRLEHQGTFNGKTTIVQDEEGKTLER